MNLEKIAEYYMLSKAVLRLKPKATTAWLSALPAFIGFAKLESGGF